MDGFSDNIYCSQEIADTTDENIEERLKEVRQFNYRWDTETKKGICNPLLMNKGKPQGFFDLTIPDKAYTI